MSSLAPIELNFYNNEDEVVKTYSRNRIPSYLLDMAINLEKAFTDDGQTQDNVNLLFDFIVEFFGRQFTRDELKQKSDLVECLSVLPAILSRANQLAAQFARTNPPVPSPKKK